MFPSLIARFFRPSASKLTMAPIGGGMSLPGNTEKATFAAGCFWSVEYLFRKEFTGKGLLDARVGYTGGDSTDPTYRSVSYGKTGHAEALQTLYNPSEVTYDNLLEFFFRMHDPTTVDRQGPDVGSQYRSAIFFHNDQQQEAANEILKKVKEQWYKTEMATQIVPAGKWWDAEDYNQNYSDRSEFSKPAP
ncbi:methionine sulfoxide reductase A [Choiromyces venosus 120613-1]|uniref:peptide-methionine (S)-S-oxide reductase n=1 Tax=Choiromyces venosus 120613-1 TaxID=1336337 RepID=A0A3N4JGV5_9PEZI|nr:methionine sulfoxide reductase A [Choiromyces venosus 120613-1]